MEVLTKILKTFHILIFYIIYVVRLQTFQRECKTLVSVKNCGKFLRYEMIQLRSYK